MEHPKSVVVLGASPDRRRFANKAVRAWREAGWRVFPVHPSATVVEGIPCHAAIEDVPGPIDTLSLYVRPEIGIRSLEAAAAKGVRDVYVNPGTGDTALLGRIRALGMRPIEACSIVALGRSPSEFED